METESFTLLRMMERYNLIAGVGRKLIAFLLLVPAAVSFAAAENDYFYRSIRIVEVLDGATARLENGEILRLAGVEVPAITEDPIIRREAMQSGIPVEVLISMGKMSLRFTRELIEGKRVRIKFGKQKSDYYGVLIGYVFLESDLMVNSEIIQSGFGRFRSIPGNHAFYELELEESRENALRNTKGLWKTWLECE